MFKVIFQPSFSPEKPYISVVVIAYDRRKFIQEAVQSVIEQTLDRTKYEIIVVKNYMDDQVDEFLKRNDVTNVYTDEKLLGAKVSYGIENARGEAISFLEDDDLYLPFKLEDVYEVFRENTNVVYFKDEIIETKNVKDTYAKSNEIEKLPTRRQVFSGDQLNSVKDLVYMVRKYKGDFSCSSIAVRRDYYLSYVPIIQNFYYMIDSAIFFWPFFIHNEGTSLVFQRKPLSIWRIHQSWTNLGDRPTMDRIMNRSIQNAQDPIKTLEILTKLLKNYISQGYIIERKTPLKIYFQLSLNGYSSIVKIFRGEQFKIEEITDLFKLGVYKRERFVIILSFLAFLSIFTPSVSNRTFKWVVWKFYR